ncbi:disks large homolog 5 [Octopus bimaculoides]|uniref:disks large homolog 5 n=1 Tax=Octopus bimaculoides TaxID=37653 RepID=UPI0022E2B75C|nr:disks large homolog 5 [Octopus bimaculoides]
MDEKHKELLELHRSKFVRAIDVDRIYSILKSADVLSDDDISTINSQTSKTAKVEKLLDILPSKGMLAFQNLCHALETTYPHLLTLMFLGGNHKNDSWVSPYTDTQENGHRHLPSTDTTTSTTSSNSKTYTKFIPSYEYESQLNHNQACGSEKNTTTVPPGHNGNSSDSHAIKPKLADFHFMPKVSQPQSNKDYRSSLNGEVCPSERVGDYDLLKAQYERAKNELLSLKRQQAEAGKDSETYRKKYVCFLNLVSQSAENNDNFSSQNLDFNARMKRLEQEVTEKQEVLELRKQHQEPTLEVGMNEVAGKMCDNPSHTYDGLYKQYEILHQRYTDLVTKHTTTLSELKNIREEIGHTQKSYEDLCLERDNAVSERNSLQQQCTTAIRNWDASIHEISELKDTLDVLNLQREKQIKDSQQTIVIHLQTKKDLENVSRERDAALREYSLIMSERDMVHKEIEQLQDKVTEATKRIEVVEGEKKNLESDVKKLQNQAVVALNERDKALKDYADLFQKYSDVITKHDGNSNREDFPSSYSLLSQDHLSYNHQQMEEQNMLFRESFERMQMEKAEEIEQGEREANGLRAQIEKLQHELNDALQEAELAKKRRDWAFGERSKIVQERESIKNLCDSLRRDRDRAVSDLAQALRDSDELKKQKNDAHRQLKELKEKHVAFLEKETRKYQLNSIGHNHSRDSAIDADMLEWETETHEIDINGQDTSNLGFELVGGIDDPQFPHDTSIFIGHVNKGSPADGKLKVNDIVIQVNNVDVTNVERKVALEAIVNTVGIIKMVIRRRRSMIRSWQPIQLNVSSLKDMGIQIENGIFISRISAGSVIAKDGMLIVGDRISSINGQNIDCMSASEVTKILQTCGEMIMLEIWRQTASPANSTGSSPTPICQTMIRSLHEQSVISAATSDHSCNEADKDHLWDSGLEESKDSRSVRHSGSQTDSLDSPQPPHRKSNKSSHQKESENKSRHSASDKLLEKAWDFFKKGRHSKYIDKQERNAAQTDEDKVIAEFNTMLNEQENYNGRKKKELEHENSGTWPKYRGMQTNVSGQGTVIVSSQKRKDRPPLSVILQDYVPSYKAPPVPPERTHSSFAASIRHSPQNSEVGRQMPSANRHSPQNSEIGRQTPSANSQTSKLMKLTTLTPYLTKSVPPPSTKDHFQKNMSDCKTLPSSHTPLHSSPTALDAVFIDSYSKGVRPKSIPNKYEKKLHPLPAAFNHVTAPQLNQRRSHPSEMPSFHPSTPFVPKTSSVSPPLQDCGNFHRLPDRLSPVVTNPRARNASSYSNSVAGQTTLLRQPNQSSIYQVPSHSSNGPVNTSSSTLGSNTHSVSPRHSSQSYINTSIPEMEADRTPYHLRSIDFRSSMSPTSSQPSTNNNTPSHNEDFPYNRLQRYPLHSREIQEFSGCSTFPKHGHERIRIPSNTSVVTKSSVGRISTSSFEVVSERSSPMSPVMFPLERSSTPSLVPPLSNFWVHSKQGRKPKPGDTRSMSIEMSSEPVGFKIEALKSGGIFVSSISENSLAVEHDLYVGDQLLEVCGINMRTATYQLAASVLRQCRETLTMLVQYNPHKFNSERSESNLCSSPSDSSELSKKPNHLVSNETITPSSPSSENTHHRISTFSSPDSMHLPSNQCCVQLKKTKSTSSLGLSFVGGQGGIGVFVKDIHSNSIADGVEGLSKGCQILEFNGTNLRHATIEQAMREISKATNSVKIISQYNPEKYFQGRCNSGFPFYIRAHFDYHPDDGEEKGELSFNRNDILLVKEGFYDNQSGDRDSNYTSYWLGWLINNQGKKVKYGKIPTRLGPNFDLKRSSSESLNLLEDELKCSRRGSGTVRRSFFKRKKHQRTNSRDSRDLTSFSDISLNVELLPVLDDGYFCGFTKVEKNEGSAIRPVILLAPLAEPLINKLTAESPDKFCKCDITTLENNAQNIEKGQAEGFILECYKRENYCECYTVSSVKRICDKNCHCLLNVSPEAIDRLHRQQIFPIVLLVKQKTPKQIREVRDVQFWTEKISSKNSKERFEQFQKIEHDYRHLITVL